MSEQTAQAGAALLCALAALPERHRYVIVAHVLRGHTYETIAASLGISKARVYQLVHVAEDRLAKELAPWREEMIA